MNSRAGSGTFVKPTFGLNSRSGSCTKASLAAINLFHLQACSAPLLKECRTILERGDPPSAESTKTLAAIDLAVSAHEKRNRVVHDLWLPTQSGYDSLSAVRIDVASMFGGELGRCSTAVL